MSFLQEIADKGVLNPNQISAIMKSASENYEGDVEAAILASGLIDVDMLLGLKSEYFNIPSKKVDFHNFSSRVLKLIPMESVLKYKFAPIGIQDNVIELGIFDPSDTSAMDALQFLASNLNMPFKIFLISRQDFEKILVTYKGGNSQVDEALTDLDSGTLGVDTSGISQAKQIENKKNKSDEEKIVEDAPIVKIVDVILETAVTGNASDIHIENTGEKVKVRFRVDGVLHTSLMLPLNAYNGVVARIKLKSNLRLDEKRKPQDGGFSKEIDRRKIDFRVSSLPTYYGEKIVMRILDSEKGVKPMNKLGLSERNVSLIREAIAKPYGLILITGPTGSGKSTTLYSMLNELDREKMNVISLEDPVEYHIPDMNQSQVMPEIGYTFASGLRSILRQDPDVIFVGEIRDKETAQLAIQAALTGHLVLSTLHTNNAIGAIPRLIDMGIDPYLIAPTLILTVAQRLARLMCPSSAKKVPLDESTRLMLDKELKDFPEEYRNKLNIGNDMYDMVPSSDCPLGTRGRIAIYEMFAVDKDIQNIILKNPVEGEIYKTARLKGMLTMREDALIKALHGEIPMQEVYAL